MPVSFSVPKQTKRSRFVIDTFRGVDYTSAGIDVDSSRSPNAPNMVRHTPGKVRKRMGYSKEFHFGGDQNMNYALGTSMEDHAVIIKDEDINQPIKLYDLIETIDNDEGITLSVDIDFYYKAENDFSILYEGYTIPASEEWTHYNGSIYVSSFVSARNIKIWSSVAQEIHIKEFAILKIRSSDYKWRPAPKKYQKFGNYSQVPNTVYGCHPYRALVSDNKQSTTNVNRVLDTSSSFKFYSLTSSWSDLETLAEYVYTDANASGDVYRRIYVEFDYTLTGTSNAYISFAASYKSSEALTPTSTPIHKSYSLTAGSYSNKDIQAKLVTSGATATLQIKNLFVGYDKNDSYSWSKAPEDSGTYFTPNVYWEGKRNYTIITDDYYSTISSATSNLHALTVVPSGGAYELWGFSYVTFKVSCTVSDTSGYTKTEIYCRDGEGYKISDSVITLTSIPNNYKYVRYMCAGQMKRPVDIVVRHYFSTGVSRTFAYTYSQIEVRNIAPRDAYNLISPIYYLYHVDQYLYLKATNKIQQIGNLKRTRSWSVQMGDDLIILDGDDISTYTFGNPYILSLDPYYCYIPTITKSRKPTGGGTPYDSLNLLTPGFKDSFYIWNDEATATQFQLSYAGLDNTTVRAWQLFANGTWAERYEGTHFTVNRTTGVVTFTNAPGISPIEGSDNIIIQAYHTVDGYRDRIAKCKFGAVYGVNGRPDRLFVSGNPDYPSQDFFSEMNDYTYFPDTNYSSLGASPGDITGYAKVGNYLGTFKKENEHENSLILREGVVVTNEDGSVETQFRIVNTLQGEGMVSPFTMGYLEGEPLYLSKKGIFAVTANDGTEAKYGQNRSFFLNGKLNEETGLEEGYSTIFNNMYILSLNNRLYVLDGLQPSYSEDEPYSTKQYSAFYCENIPATCIWTEGDDLYFGTADGNICKFYTDPQDTNSYEDDGYPIEASWETPDLDGYLFYKNKTFRYFALRMMKAFRTSFKIFTQKYSIWTFIKEDDTTGRTFDFNRINFAEFSFSTDWSEKLSHTKLRIKKVDKARFKIENSKLHQPFGIYDMALEYLENGNYKR